VQGAGPAAEPTGSPAAWDALVQSVREVEQRVSNSVVDQRAWLEALDQRIDHVQQQQQHAESEASARGEQAIALASQALARADETLQRVDGVATASQARDADTASLLNRVSADSEALGSSFHDVEQRLAAVAARQDSGLAWLRQQVDQVQHEYRQHADETSGRSGRALAQAADALRCAEQALERIESVSAASQSRDADATELLRQLSAGWEALSHTVRDVEQRVALVAARQESGMEELRQLVDQARRDQEVVVGKVHTAGQQAAARADDAVRRADAGWERIEAIAAASHARETDTTDLLGRLSRGWDGLSGTVRDVEQRVAVVATRQESGLEELRTFVEQAQREQRQLVGEVSARGEQAAIRADEALARADDALERIGTVAAASQAREAATTELLSRLSVGWETLTETVRDVEQRIAVRHESGLAELRDLVDQVQREQRQVAGEATLRGEQATTRSNEALTRADETLRRLEAVATASQAHQESITELLGRLSSGWDGVTNSVRAVEQRMAAVEAQVEPLKGVSAERVRERPRTERTAITEQAVLPRRLLGVGAPGEAVPGSLRGWQSRRPECCWRLRY